MAKLFDIGGATWYGPTVASDAVGFITIKAMNAKGGNAESKADTLASIIDGTAPISGITITQAVDFSVTKSLQSDFYAAAFGDEPVTIRITGLSIYSCKSRNEESIADFYTKNKISANPTARVLIGINWGKQKDMFKCILTGLELEGESSRHGAGHGLYTLELLGVQYVG